MTEPTPPIASDDDVDLLTPGTLIVLVDPLCGWCWGAAPALRRLAEAGLRLEVVASGLFIGDRALTPDFAAYAWDNDQKIRALTGQTFSEAYRQKVLGQPDGKIDSGPATLAFTAVQLIEPAAALDTLHALQAARWVDGLDITSEAVVADVLRRAGRSEQVVAAFLAEDDAVIEALNQRATLARDLLESVGARGVPTLLRVTPTGVTRLDGRILFENVADVVEHATA